MALCSVYQSQYMNKNIEKTKPVNGLLSRESSLPGRPKFIE
jgi:hypothetical protein